MATKNTRSKSRGGKKRRRKTERPAGNAYESRYEILFIATSLAAILLFLSLIGVTGPIGKGAKRLMFGLLGTSAWVLPFFIFIASGFYIANHGNRRVKRGILLSFFLLCLFSAFFELLAFGNVSDLLWKELYTESAEKMKGGGFLGGAVAKFLCAGIALPGAYLVILGGIIVLLILLTGRLFLNPISRMAAETREKAADYGRERLLIARQRAEENEKRRREAHTEKMEERRERREREAKERAERMEAGKLLREKEKEEREKREKEEEKERKKIKERAKIETELKEIGSAEKSDLSDLIGKALGDEDKKDVDSGMYMKELDEKFGKPVMEKKDDALRERTKKEVIEAENVSLSWEPLVRAEDERTEAESFEVPYQEESEVLFAEDSVTTSIKEEKFLHPNEEKDRTPMREGPTTSFERKEADLQYERERILREKKEQRRPEKEIRTVREEPKAISRPSTRSEQGEFRSENGEKERTATSEMPEAIREENKRPYSFPPKELLITSEKKEGGASSEELHETARKLQTTLSAFGVNVKITDVSSGPAVTRYELQPEIGVKVSRITALSDDIKLNLAAADIRIEAPIPGKAAVGIEVPNKKNMTVHFRELIEAQAFREDASKVSFAVGKDIGGKIVVADIAKMPHLLIAGATGSGKSVCINTLIMSILYKAKPEEVKFIMIDPKVVELSVYNGIPHLLLPVVTDPKKAAGALGWAVAEMERRYRLFAEKGVRNIKGYNKSIEGGEEEKMPQIVIIVDELADLMMVSAKEVEASICRLAQLARAAGIHLVIATQRPSVNVITGLIKANIPSRIAFAVSSQVDSRTILDGAGAEKLLGKGDMLFFPGGYPKPVRVQGAFVSDNEVFDVANFIKKQFEGQMPSADISEQVNAAILSENPKESGEKGGSEEADDGYDDYFEEAGKLIIEKEKASIGMLQRVYRIGFNRAARIMDQLAEAGVVSEEDGTRPRKILMEKEEFYAFLELRNGGSAEEIPVSEEPYEQN